MQRTSITLTSITCHGTSENGHDEVYVIFQADAGFRVRAPLGPRRSQSMTSGDSWAINHTQHFVNDLLVTLYDSDPGVNAFSDYLVSYDYTPLSIPSSITLTNPNGASYTLYAQVNAAPAGGAE